MIKKILLTILIIFAVIGGFVVSCTVQVGNAINNAANEVKERVSDTITVTDSYRYDFQSSALSQYKRELTLNIASETNDLWGTEYVTDTWGDRVKKKDLFVFNSQGQKVALEPRSKSRFCMGACQITMGDYQTAIDFSKGAEIILGDNSVKKFEFKLPDSKPTLEKITQKYGDIQFVVTSERGVITITPSGNLPSSKGTSYLGDFNSNGNSHTIKASELDEHTYLESEYELDIDGQAFTIVLRLDKEGIEKALHQ